MAALYPALVILIMSVTAIALCRRFKLPPVFGYLIVGFLAGPYTLQLVQSDAYLHTLAELGIAFLLFSIGLEFSLSQMFAMRRIVFGVGIIQVGLTATLLIGIGSFFPIDNIAVIILGLALAMSSTALVIKLLKEQGELHEAHGNIALGILIFQDLLAVPLLLFVSAIALNDDAASFVYTFLKSMAALTALILMGHFLLPRLFKEVASARSAELFTLSALLVIGISSAITHTLSLPLALGSFIAGIMLGDSAYRYQIESDIRPFKDVLMGIFFISVGMLVNPYVFLNYAHWIIAAALGLIIVKGLVVFAGSMALRFDLEASLRSAISLCHVGEFGFAIITLALSLNLLPQRETEIILSAAIVTLFVAALLVNHNYAISQRSRLLRYSKLKTIHKLKQETYRSAHNHVIICGFGRVGQIIGQVLKKYDIPYFALDMDPVRIEDAGKGGEPVYYGNSSDENILKALHIQNAKLLITTYIDTPSTLKTLHVSKSLRPQMPVLVRSNDQSQQALLRESGASEIIEDTLESSLSLSLHTLLISGFNPTSVFKDIRNMRNSHYHLLHAFYQGQEDVQEGKRVLHSLTITPDSAAEGKRLGTICHTDSNLTIQAVRRRGIRGEEPNEQLIIQAGDVLILNGTPEAIETLEKTLV